MKALEKAAALFVAKFFVLFALMYAALLCADISQVQIAIAKLEACLLGLESSGSGVRIGNETFEITSQCTGLVSAITLAAIVFSLRRPSLKAKAALALCGVATLTAVNLVRLYAVLAIAARYGAEAGDIAHTVSWFAMSAAVIALWYFATKRLVGAHKMGELL